MNLDLYLFNLINGFAGKWAWLDYFGIFCADYLGYILLVVFLAYAVKKIFFTSAKPTASPNEKYFISRMVILALFSAGIARFVFAEAIRLVWFRARPFVAENFIPLISQSPTEASFPSGHATFYFALATIVYFYNKKIGAWFFVASFFIAISRVFVGVHWPLDILAGALIGILTGWLSYKLFKKYENYIFRSWRGF
jgi:undecaprenyl-diphosphatase